MSSRGREGGNHDGARPRRQLGVPRAVGLPAARRGDRRHGGGGALHAHPLRQALAHRQPRRAARAGHGVVPRRGRHLLGRPRRDRLLLRPRRRAAAATSACPTPRGSLRATGAPRRARRPSTGTTCWPGTSSSRGRRVPASTSCAHHLCHAASAFLPSGFDEAAVLVVDGIGELGSTWLGLGRGSELVELETVALPATPSASSGSACRSSSASTSTAARAR